MEEPTQRLFCSVSRSRQYYWDVGLLDQTISRCVIVLTGGNFRFLNSRFILQAHINCALSGFILQEHHLFWNRNKRNKQGCSGGCSPHVHRSSFWIFARWDHWYSAALVVVMAHQRPHFPLRTINVLNICVWSCDGGRTWWRAVGRCSLVWMLASSHSCQSRHTSFFFTGRHSKTLIEEKMLKHQFIFIPYYILTNNIKHARLNFCG